MRLLVFPFDRLRLWASDTSRLEIQSDPLLGACNQRALGPSLYPPLGSIKSLRGRSREFRSAARRRCAGRYRLNGLNYRSLVVLDPVSVTPGRFHHCFLFEGPRGRLRRLTASLRPGIAAGLIRMRLSSPCVEDDTEALSRSLAG